nr:unnamed protein product [Callosobruchus chinensis]
MVATVLAAMDLQVTP